VQPIEPNFSVRQVFDVWRDSLGFFLEGPSTVDFASPYASFLWGVSSVSFFFAENFNIRGGLSLSVFLARRSVETGPHFWTLFFSLRNIQKLPRFFNRPPMLPRPGSSCRDFFPRFHLRPSSLSPCRSLSLRDLLLEYFAAFLFSKQRSGFFILLSTRIFVGVLPPPTPAVLLSWQVRLRPCFGFCSP